MSRSARVCIRYSSNAYSLAQALSYSHSLCTFYVNLELHTRQEDKPLASHNAFFTVSEEQFPSHSSHSCFSRVRSPKLAAWVTSKASFFSPLRTDGVATRVMEGWRCRKPFLSAESSVKSEHPALQQMLICLKPCCRSHTHTNTHSDKPE